MLLCRIVCVGDGPFAPAILRRPLLSSGRALGQLPVKLEQVFEEVVAPLRRCCSPGDFQATADRVSAMTFSILVLPPEALLMNVSAFRLGAYVISGNGRAVGFAERMPTGNQCDRFFIVHGHAAEGFANVPACSNGIGFAVRAFRVHVDQTHLNCPERILLITIAGIAFVRQPRAFWSPVDFLLRLPDIGASAGKSKSLKTHRF